MARDQLPKAGVACDLCGELVTRDQAHTEATLRPERNATHITCLRDQTPAT